MTAGTTPARRHHLRRPTWPVWLLAGAVAAPPSPSWSWSTARAAPCGGPACLPSRSASCRPSTASSSRAPTSSPCASAPPGRWWCAPTTTSSRTSRRRCARGASSSPHPGSFSTCSADARGGHDPLLRHGGAQRKRDPPVQNVRAKTLKVTLTGSGVLRASGTAHRVVATLGGSGVEALGGVVARDAHAVVTGSGASTSPSPGRWTPRSWGPARSSMAGNPKHVTTSVTGKGAITPGGGQP